MDNKINYQIPAETISQVDEKLAEVVALLKPYMISLRPRERHDLPKMSDGTLPFVLKCLNYCESEPQFAPPFVSLEEFTNDMQVWEQLVAILRPVTQLYQNLDDTVMEAGAESYTTALSFYNSVKQAAKMDIPGAKSIYEDLKRRFVKNTSKKMPEAI